MASPLSINSLFSVDGLTAVVTGGGSGIGLMMAKALAVNGAAKVYILGRRLDRLQAAAAETSKFIPIECDVASKTSLQSAVDRITAESGYINLLVANSGTASAVRWDPNASVEDLRRTLFEDHSMEEFTDVYNVNATGAFFTIIAFLELLDAGNKRALAGGFGSPAGTGIADSVQAIQSQAIVTGSISAFSRFQVASPSYLGSKAAITQLVKQASSMLAKHGIRVNALAPGLFPSELAAGAIAARKPEEEDRNDPMFLPSRRFGGEEEMAGTLLYLASRAGSYCNGLALVMDGGRLGVMPSSY